MTNSGPRHEIDIAYDIFNQLLLILPYPLLMLDQDNYIIKANAAACDLLGYTSDEIAGLPLSATYPPGEYDQTQQHLTPLKGGSPVLIERQAVTKGGSLVSIETSISPMIEGFDYMVMRKRVGEQENSDKYTMIQKVFNTINDAIFSVDTEYRYTSFNFSHARIMKTLYGAEIKLGSNMLDYQTVEADRITAKQNIDRALAGEIVMEEGLSGETEKERNYFEVSHYPIYSNTVSIIGVAVWARDITEKKQTEEKLEIADTKYEKLTAIALDGIIIFDDDGVISAANQAACGIFGYPPNGLTGHHIIETYLPFDSSLYTNKMEQLSRDESVQLYERHALTKNKTPILIEVTLVKISPEYNQAIIRDITKRKHAEKELEVSELKYRLLFESANDGILILNADTGVVEDANIAIPDIFGREYHDIIGKNAREIGIDIPDSFIEELKTKKEVYYDNIPLLTGYGNTIEIELRCSYYKTGQKYVIQCNIRDITERRLAHEAIIESEDMYRSIIMASVDAIIVIDTSGKVSYASPKAYKLFRIADKTKIIGRKVIDLIMPGYRVKMIDTMNKISTIQETAPQEYLLRRENGETFYAEAGSAPLFSANGDIRGMVTVLHDITERRKAEKQIARLNRIYKMVRSCNQALVRTNEEKELISAICDMIVSHGGYRMAWVGYVQGEKNRTVSPIAWAGYEEEYLKTVSIRWGDNEFGNGLTGTTIKTGNISVNQNILTDPVLLPWKLEAIKRGYNSSVALPLQDNGKVFGALTVYAAEPDAFNEEEVELLSELAADLAYGIVAIRERIEHSRAEAALRESEHFLNNIVENIPDMLFIKEAKNLNFIRFNKAGENLLGYNRSDLIGKNDYDFFPKEQADFFTSNDRDIIAKGELLDIAEEPIDTKLLGRRYLHTKKIPVIADDGTPLYLLGISEDITERKLVEEALRESEDRFKYMFEHSPIGKSITTPDGKISVNKAFCDLLGYSESELIHTRWQDITHPDDIEISEKAINPLLTGEQGSARFVKRYLHKGGSVIWADVSTSLRIGKAGKPLYFMTNVVDITERKLAEEKITQLNTELEQKVKERTAQLEVVNSELEAFTYSVSHDLRAPLRAIDGYSCAIDEEYTDKLDDTGKNYISRIHTNVQQMNDLIDDLLKLSRLTRGEVNNATISLSEIATSVITGLRESEPGRDIKIIISPDISADADHNLMEIALTNLLNNAWKYTSKTENPEIEFGSFIENGKTIYYVKDNGAGFDMAHIDKLFTPFQRFHTIEEFPGTGIGLATVKRIIEKQNGKVWVKSEIGKGATFYFTLS